MPLIVRYNGAVRRGATEQSLLLATTTPAGHNAESSLGLARSHQRLDSGARRSLGWVCR
jgi:hypothetical protein